MRTLELEKIWTGDGYGASNAITLRQLKRTETVALYERISKDGRQDGYEVFIVKKRLKGQALPGGLFEQEDREVYPSANSFGRTAWNPGSLGNAEKIYVELVQGEKPGTVTDNTSEDDEPETPEPVVAVVDTAGGGTPPAHRGRGRVKGPRPQLNVLDGEFSVKDLAAANNVEYSVAFIFIKEAIEGGTIRFARSERRAVKGKETNLYAKV